ncbi:hypothetical protein DSO57_1031496 [Entomophthora muscae]|uniref:Uncharacterized protein n=1 Tax=Entomophthora muscae TaxID=34485 RepID=A0ACC2SQ23_9FUNG|nr:hypothetical protein DSO57_1031496 [Entomophthora muscae]
MDYQPGPDPGMTGIPYDSPAPPIPQPYDHSRAGMIILTILSLAKVVIPNLGAYRPLASGLLYLTRSAPFLYWALVTRYLDRLSSPSMPWHITASGHESWSSYVGFCFILFLAEQTSLDLLPTPLRLKTPVA